MSFQLNCKRNKNMHENFAIIMIIFVCFLRVKQKSMISLGSVGKNAYLRSQNNINKILLYMKRIFTLFGIVFSLVMQAQQMPQVPNDPQVTQGKLENGLTYYIRQNAYPEKRAAFVIAQNVGSIQEKDSQRGLAHFLEHMCFNGSDHFEGNGIIEYLRTIGVEFGSDLNAQTGVENTFYYINNVPTEREASLDSCLLILKDWTNGLTLDEKEIDKERGVIHEEWRSRSNTIIRMYESQLPKLFPNNKYGSRLPIGTMDVVDNFKYDELKSYYKEWYHPENQCIIVVGDIDVERTEAKIKEMFSGNKKAESASPVVPLMVEDNAQPLIALYRDKEPYYDQNSRLQANNIVFVMNKHAAFDKAQKSTLAYLINRYFFSAVCSMLNERLEDLSQKEDCNFLQAGVNDGEYIFASTVNAFEMVIIPKDAAHAAAAVKEVLMEVRRAAEQGFSEDEYNRFKENYMASLESRVNNVDSRESLLYAYEYMENFFSAEPYPAISQKYGLMKRIIAQLPFNGVNQIMEQVYSKDDSNMAVLNFNIETEGAAYPTEADLLKAIKDAHNADLATFEGTTVDKELVKFLPKPGTIKSESKKNIGDIEYTELVLSNGVKVILKQTDFKKDEIIMYGNGTGGASVYGPQDYANILAFNSVIGESGLGGLSNSDLSKALSGKKANVSYSLSPTGLGMQMLGTTRPKDVETMMQLAFLKFTNITRDDKAYAKWLKNKKSDLEGKTTQPELIFSDSLACTMYGHNPRVAPMTVNRLEEVSYDRILQMAKERLGSANGWTFTIVGNFDEENIKSLLCQYIGSLPANKENKSELAVRPVKNKVENYFGVNMESPISLIVLNYMNQDMDYTVENQIHCDLLGRVLTDLYLKKIREEEGLSYGAQASGDGNVEIDGSHQFAIQAVCQTAPDKSALAMGMMQNEINSLQETPIDASTLNKAKKQLISQYEQMQKKNEYMLSVIQEYLYGGIDVHTDFAKKADAVTPESLTNFTKEFLKADNSVFLIMSPR